LLRPDFIKRPRHGLQGREIAYEQYERIEALEAFARERDLSLLEVAIGGLAAQPPVASVIAGATKPEQVRRTRRRGNGSRRRTSSPRCAPSADGPAARGGATLRLVDLPGGARCRHLAELRQSRPIRIRFGESTGGYLACRKPSSAAGSTARFGGSAVDRH
jgi:hypothetical protein